MKCIMSLLGAFIISRALIAVTPPTTVITKTLEAQNLHQLNLAMSEGNIHIEGEKTDKATVTVTKGNYDPACILNIETAGEALHIRIDKPTLSATIKCEAKIHVVLPQKVKLSLEAGAAVIVIKNTIGAISYEIGAGSVTVDGEISDLLGESGAATIDVKGLTGNAYIQGGSVTFTATFLSVPKTGRLKVELGSGNSTVYVPANSRIATQLEAGVGTLSNELATTSDAYLISMEAGMGNLVIKSIPK